VAPSVAVGFPAVAALPGVALLFRGERDAAALPARPGGLLFRHDVFALEVCAFAHHDYMGKHV
jgi:hypothetical protein